MSKKTSSYDVAREAKVSRATVSYILNNVSNIKIKPETREKVLLAAQKLGYRPSSIARALKTNRSMSIGVVSRRGVDEERFSKVLKGIKNITDLNDYSILLCSDEIDKTGKPQYYNYFLENRIDGVLLLSHIESININEISNNAEIIKKNNIPAVFIDYHMDDDELNRIDIDYYNGGYIAAKFLLDNGHKNVFYLDPGTGTVQENERIRGVFDAFDEKGLSQKSINIVTVKSFDETGWKTVEHILRNPGEYTALIAGWIHYGFKVLHTANLLGIKIPYELAVIALADSYFAGMSYPMLTTSQLPLVELGSKSAKILIGMLQKELPQINKKLSCKLIVRNSV